jgi:hypothetical protein
MSVPENRSYSEPLICREPILAKMQFCALCTYICNYVHNVAREKHAGTLISEQLPTAYIHQPLGVPLSAIYANHFFGIRSHDPLLQQSPRWQAEKIPQCRWQFFKGGHALTLHIQQTCA